MVCCAAAAATFGWGCATALVRDGADDVARASAADRERRETERRLRPARRAVRIMLIRHAQSQTNVDKDGLHNGRHLDVPLSERGVAQARALGKRLARCGEEFEAVYCSEALRTQQTAEVACAALHDPPPVQVMPTRDLGLASRARGVCEIAMGSWTGKNKQACETAEVKAAREADCWEWCPPGRCEAEGIPAESYRDVEERFVRFIDEVILPKAAHLDRAAASAAPTPVILVFSHHAAIRCALRPLLEASPRMLAPKLSPQNTSITELSYSPAEGRKGGWTLHRVNDAAHLEGTL
jgi:broad specificity phosphatase PhoE